MKAVVSKPFVIFSFGGYSFIRWIISLPMADGSTSLGFQVQAASGLFPATSGSIVVPGKAQAWNFGYNSCNGFHDLASAPATGIEPLWSDVLAQHQTRPFHLMISDGDQVTSMAFLHHFCTTASSARSFSSPRSACIPPHAALQRCCLGGHSRVRSTQG